MRLKYCCIFFIFICISNASFATENAQMNFFFDTGAKYGGITNELVFEGEKCISRLDWADDIIPVAGITANMKYYGLFLDLSLQSAVPVMSGRMEDYDYLLPGSGMASQYSFHDAYLDKDFTCGAELGYDFKIGNWYIMPSAGFQYQNRKWTAADGYLQYPITGEWTGDEPKETINGSVISYEQAIWYPFAALEAGYVFPFGSRGGKHVYSAGGKLFPYIWAHTNDTHFLRSRHFYDTLEGGIGWSTWLNYGYYPSNANGIGLIMGIGYETITGLKGNTSSNNTGVYTGPLIIDDGYNSKMENKYYYFSISVFVPVIGR